MPYFHESRWQDMNKESSDELVCRQRHDLASGIILVVSPLETYHAIGNAQYTVVGNSDAMRITAKVLDNTTGVFERGLAVDDPLFCIKGRKEVIPSHWFG